jgi:hypothetical protein
MSVRPAGLLLVLEKRFLVSLRSGPVPLRGGAITHLLGELRGAAVCLRRSAMSLGCPLIGAGGAFRGEFCSALGLTDILRRRGGAGLEPVQALGELRRAFSSCCRTPLALGAAEASLTLRTVDPRPTFGYALVTSLQQDLWRDKLDRDPARYLSSRRRLSHP